MSWFRSVHSSNRHPATHNTAVLAALLLFLLQIVPMARSQHTPIIDGDDSHDPRQGLYKGLYHGYLYGHWNDAGSNTMDTGHKNDGINHASNVKARCLDGSICDS